MPTPEDINTHILSNQIAIMEALEALSVVNARTLRERIDATEKLLEHSHAHPRRD
ncbi:MAG TPA: hypothetical protein VKD65_12075 [Candidatus Angelobacter sp.]|nr:hypothetical protein [Candidatus Angelobacter sp.]